MAGKESPKAKDEARKAPEKNESPVTSREEKQEKVAEFPLLTKKLLFREPFSYGTKDGPRQYADVPAVFLVKKSYGETLVEITDSNGKDVGLVDILENKPESWNTRLAFQPTTDRQVEITDADGKKETLPKELAGELFPIVHVDAKGAMTIGRPFGKQTAIRFPCTVEERAKDGLIQGVVGVLSTENELQKAKASIGFIHEMTKDKANPGDIDRSKALTIIQNAIFALASGEKSTVDSSESILKNAKILNAYTPNSLKTTAPNMAVMPAENYKAWITGIGRQNESIQDAIFSLNGSPDTKERHSTATITKDGKPHAMAFIPMNRLP